MPHILKNFDDELSSIKGSVVEMGTMAISAFDKAVSGLADSDRDLCYDVIDEDGKIDQCEKAIDELGMSILLRFNPVASDLRHVLSSINICRSLERIGDHAVIIAKHARKIIKAGELEEVRLLDPLCVEVRKSISTALTAYSDLDEELALSVLDMDSKISKIHKTLSKSLSAKISDQSEKTESLLNLIFISRSVERIGDFAVNIAEDIVFITSAEDIRHQ